MPPTASPGRCSRRRLRPCVPLEPAPEAPLRSAAKREARPACPAADREPELLWPFSTSTPPMNPQAISSTPSSAREIGFPPDPSRAGAGAGGEEAPRSARPTRRRDRRRRPDRRRRRRRACGSESELPWRLQRARGRRRRAGTAAVLHRRGRLERRPARCGGLGDVCLVLGHCGLLVGECGRAATQSAALRSVAGAAARAAG